jgi:hypothetical protein
MKRIATTIIALALLSVAGLAQSPRRSATQEPNDTAGVHTAIKRDVAPRVVDRANSFIVTGHIVSLRGQKLSVENARGARVEFQLDKEVTVLESNELVSIATMDDISLKPSDLRPADEVEVVAERVAPNRYVAHIVTRTAAGPAMARQ